MRRTGGGRTERYGSGRIRAIGAGCSSAPILELGWELAGLDMCETDELELQEVAVLALWDTLWDSAGKLTRKLELAAPTLQYRSLAGSWLD